MPVASPGVGLSSVMERFAQRSAADKPHAAGTFPNEVLARIEALLPPSLERTAETGCGKSTILFSNLSRDHTVFCIDDREEGERSSVRYFETDALTRTEVVHCVFGPSQRTLPGYNHVGPYDCVLLDGPHGYPFPELEYFHFYPHLRKGGFLIVDDVHIPTIGRMADVLQEDDMFELSELVGTTAVFRRTQAETLSPTGDSWWTQKFNQRRFSKSADFYCADGKFLQPFHTRVGGVDPLPAPPQPPPAGRPRSEPVLGLVPRLRRAARIVLRGH